MAKNAEAKLPNDFFAAQKWLFQLTGLPLTPVQSRAYKMFTFAMLILMITYLLFMLPEIFLLPNDVDSLINNLLFQAAYILAFLKMLVYLRNRSRLANMLNTLESGVFIPNFDRGGEIEENLLKNSVVYMKNQAFIIACLGNVALVFCVTVPQLVAEKDSELRLPFGTLSVVSSYCGQKFTFLYQAVAFYFACLIYTTTETACASILVYLLVQCKILQNCIKRMVANSTKAMMQETSESTSHVGISHIDNSSVPWKYLQRALKDVVIYHMAIINASEQTEIMFCPSLLILFVGMSLCFCFTMYHASLFPLISSRFLQDIFVFLAASMPLNVVSYWGSQIMQESEAVATACYELDFVGTDLRFQKGLKFIMQRSQKPIKLTIGKFSVLSLVAMLEVVRGSYSYYMFLRSINES